MTQNVVDFSDNPTGAGLMDDYLDKDQQNVLTSNSGIQRPSYAVAGTKWLDISVTPWVLKMYDGTDDVVLGTVNPSTHAFVPYGVDSKQDIANLSQTLDTSTTKYPSNAAVKAVTDTKIGLADNNTFTGTNTFTQTINRNSNEMDITVTPERDLYSQIDFRDKNDLRMGAVGIQQTSGTNIFRTRILSNREVNGVQKYSQVQAVIEPDGKMYGLAPSTPAGSVNNEIATANWVNNKFKVVSTLPASPDTNTFYYIPV